MSEFAAIGLGELLWDVLPHGKQLGGAPANFAYHFSNLGGHGIPISRIGDDGLGREALQILVEHQVPIDHILIDPEYPTGTVNASLDENGIATYTFPNNVAWDFLSLNETTMALAATADAICFGTLAQRSDASKLAIHTFLEAAPKALKIYDINLRQSFYSKETILASLKLASILKINDDELATISEMFALPNQEEAALRVLLKEYNLQFAVLTRGSQGSLIISPDHRSELPGRPTTVIDTIGAGDSFTAAMALGILKGLDLNDINEYATQVAAYVCSQSGAMPPIPASLQLT